MARSKKPRLGRGLSSLMSTPAPVQVEPPAPGPPDSTAAGSTGPVPSVRGVESEERPAAAPTAASAPEFSESDHANGGRSDHDVMNKVHSGSSVGQADRPPARVAGVAGEAVDPADAGIEGAECLTYLPITAVQPNPHQPRQSIDQTGLERLADSIRQDGLMQPVVVRRGPDDPTRYQLVAGERRMRAARLAGLDTLPAIIRQLDDRQMAEWALIENLQREDLNPIERARAFKRLIERFDLSHEQVAERVGIERPTVTNTLRLLELHHEVQNMLREGQLSGGHGRALLGVSDPNHQRAMARRAVAGGWSVRMVEAAVRRAGKADGESATRRPRSPHLEDLERQLTTQLQTKVHIRTGRRKNSGTLMIDFYDLDQFDGLLTRLGVNLD